MTAAQEASLDDALKATTSEPDLARARSESAPLVRSVLQALACWTTQGNTAPGAITRYAAPNGTISIQSPAGLMTHHPKSQCLTVTRVDDWKMVARNAVAFRAVLVSDSSGASAQRHMTLQKQPDGQWLVFRLL